MNAKQLYALQRAGYWLAEWNRLEEEGKSHTKAAREAERKAHYWLDKINDLEGYND